MEEMKENYNIFSENNIYSIMTHLTEYERITILLYLYFNRCILQISKNTGVGRKYYKARITELLIKIKSQLWI